MSASLETVLVVEDVSVMATALRAQLRQLGYRVLVADSAERALQILRHASKDALDVAILDVMMRGMSGLELLQVMRRHLPYATFPVIMLSAGVRPAVTPEAARETAAGVVSQRPARGPTGSRRGIPARPAPVGLPTRRRSRRLS